MSTEDDLDAGAQPHCAECGTVLVSNRTGYTCRNCGIDYLPNYRTPKGFAPQ